MEDQIIFHLTVKHLEYLELCSLMGEQKEMMTEWPAWLICGINGCDVACQSWSLHTLSLVATRRTGVDHGGESEGEIICHYATLNAPHRGHEIFRCKHRGKFSGDALNCASDMSSVCLCVGEERSMRNMETKDPAEGKFNSVFMPNKSSAL